MRLDSAIRKSVDWLFTVPFLIVFGLVLGIFDPLQRLAHLLGPRAHEIVVGMLQRGLLGAFRLCGTRLHVERSPAVRPWTPYLVIANHQSMFDIPIIGATLFTNFPKYVAKRELERWIPSISYNLRHGGNAVIDRGDSVQAVEAIRALGRRVERRGVAAVIFPEGTRARGGTFRNFKRRGSLELLRAAPQTAVVPLVIDGSWRLLRHNLFPVPFGSRVRVAIRDPIARSGQEDAEEILRRAEHEIRATLERWRTGDETAVAEVGD